MTINLITLLWFIKEAPRDSNYKPVVEVVETYAMGFIYLHLN